MRVAENTNNHHYSFKHLFQIDERLAENYGHQAHSSFVSNNCCQRVHLEIIFNEEQELAMKDEIVCKLVSTLHSTVRIVWDKRVQGWKGE